MWHPVCSLLSNWSVSFSSFSSVTGNKNGVRRTQEGEGSQRPHRLPQEDLQCLIWRNVLEFGGLPYSESLEFLRILEKATLD